LLTNVDPPTPVFLPSPVAGIQPVFSLFPVDLNRDGALDIVSSNGDVWTLTNNIPQVPPVSTRSAPLASIPVYPNPTTSEGFVWITRTTIMEETTYRVVNLQGQVVRRGQLRADGKVDLLGLATGQYLIHVFDQLRPVGLAKVTKR
ncbi:MAG: T9SS type A sorting domain-containing protein, partial [Bacteroidota bacterium]